MVDQEKLRKVVEELRQNILSECAEKRKAEKNKSEPVDNTISENYKPEDSLVHRFLDRDNIRFPGEHESNYKLPEGYHGKDYVLNYIRKRSLK